MKQLITLMAVLFSATSFGQSIGIGTNTPDASAQLDVTSTTKGLLIPRMNLSQRNLIAAPSAGLMIYQTDNTPGFYFYNGLSWMAVSGGFALPFANTYTGAANALSIDMLGNSNNATFKTATYNAGSKGFFGEARGNNSVAAYFTVAGSPTGANALQTDVGNVILATTSGNVGIGTSTPSAKLEINGQLKITGGSPAAGEILESDATGLATWVDKSASFLPAGTSGNTLRHNGTGWVANNVIINNGTNVGIGINPTYKLEVDGRIALRYNGASAGLWLNKADNTLSNFFGNFNDSISGVYTNYGSGWQFYFDHKNGNLGINNAAPKVPISFAALLGKKISLYPGATGDAGFGVFGNELRINSDYNGADITFGYDNYTTGFTENARLFGGGNMHLGKYGTWAAATDDRKINFGDGDYAYIGEVGADDRIELRAGSFNFKNGDVFIGTNDFIKGAGYKLRVGGKIFSEEVRVQLQSAWPDYVFEKKYKKLSLEELEVYVDKNKHLPNIPSATEVEKNGQHLGEIQQKMLEKIEELSLYIIELNKKVEMQATEIKLLKSN